jgi:hypothetical protein
MRLEEIVIEASKLSEQERASLAHLNSYTGWKRQFMQCRTKRFKGECARGTRIRR